MSRSSPPPAGAPATALDAYGIAAEVMDVCPETPAGDRATLERNRGIVMRELGTAGQFANETADAEELAPVGRRRLRIET